MRQSSVLTRLLRIQQRALAPLRRLLRLQERARFKPARRRQVESLRAEFATLHRCVCEMREQRDDARRDLAEVQRQGGDRLKQLIGKITDYTREIHDVEQTLGTALGYPRYCDDKANFPDATESDGVCVGDHTAASLAAEAATRLVEARAERDKQAVQTKHWQTMAEQNRFATERMREQRNHLVADRDRLDALARQLASNVSGWRRELAAARAALAGAAKALDHQAVMWATESEYYSDAPGLAANRRERSATAGIAADRARNAAGQPAGEGEES